MSFLKPKLYLVPLVIFALGVLAFMPSSAFAHAASPHPNTHSSASVLIPLSIGHGCASAVGINICLAVQGGTTLIASTSVDPDVCSHSDTVTLEIQDTNAGTNLTSPNFSCNTDNPDFSTSASGTSGTTYVAQATLSSGGSIFSPEVTL